MMSGKGGGAVKTVFANIPTLQSATRGATPRGETTAAEPRRTPLGILGGRDNALAAIASGSRIDVVHNLVDPARCRMWEGHNRDYAALSKSVAAI